MTMKCHRSRYSLLYLWVLLACCSALSAQEDLVRITIQPENTEWNWRPYSESIAERFAAAISDRVREGIPRREFIITKDSTVLDFLFRIDEKGNLKRFYQLVPRHRYLAYLIRRTAREIAPLRPLPADFPFFYFNGTITFRCSFKPTRWYKKLYFEEPLDSLEEVKFVPVFKTRSNRPLFLYEPRQVDKKALLEQFKLRIGVAEEIKDTSSYTPLDFKGRIITVAISCDSSSSLDSTGKQLLRTATEAALRQAGAKITEQRYIPTPPLEKDSLVAADPALAATKTDTTESPVDSSKVAETKADFALARDLVEAFSRRFAKNVLVFSVEIAGTSHPDTGICRLRLFPATRPEELKRRVEFKFARSEVSTDSLGRMLVKRLTNPPPKPAPAAAKPKPRAKVQVAKDTAGTKAIQPKVQTATDSSSAKAASTAAGSPVNQPAPKETGKTLPAAQDTAATAGDTLAHSKRVPATGSDTTKASSNTSGNNPKTASQPSQADSSLKSTRDTLAPATPQAPDSAASSGDTGSKPAGGKP